MEVDGESVGIRERGDGEFHAFGFREYVVAELWGARQWKRDGGAEADIGAVAKSVDRVSLATHRIGVYN